MGDGTVPLPPKVRKPILSRQYRTRGDPAERPTFGQNSSPFPMRWTRVLTVTTAVLAGCTTTDAAPPPGDYAPARFADAERSSKLLGIAYGILIDGKLVHAGTVGLRDVAAGAPVDSASVFRIASMTKSFTA